MKEYAKSSLAIILSHHQVNTGQQNPEIVLNLGGVADKVGQP
jgi:hypothetical protein